MTIDLYSRTLQRDQIQFNGNFRLTEVPTRSPPSSSSLPLTASPLKPPNDSLTLRRIQRKEERDEVPASTLSSSQEMKREEKRRPQASVETVVEDLKLGLEEGKEVKSGIGCDEEEVGNSDKDAIFETSNGGTSGAQVTGSYETCATSIQLGGFNAEFQFEEQSKPSHELLLCDDLVAAELGGFAAFEASQAEETTKSQVVIDEAREDRNHYTYVESNKNPLTCNDPETNGISGVASDLCFQPLKEEHKDFKPEQHYDFYIRDICISADSNDQIDHVEWLRGSASDGIVPSIGHKTDGGSNLDLQTQKVHIPLDILLAQAKFEDQQITNAKKHYKSLHDKKSQASLDDGCTGKAWSSNIASKKSIEPSLNQEDYKEWNSPTRSPVSKKQKRRFKRKQSWMRFICCLSIQ